MSHPSKPLAFDASVPCFEVETIATIAAILLSQPANLAVNLSYSSACRLAHNLLVAAARFNTERCEVIAGKVAD
jgi:hypothetical protein